MKLPEGFATKVVHLQQSTECMGAHAGAAAGAAADKAAAAQAAAAGIVADVQRRLQGASQPGPDGGLKALSIAPQVPCSVNHLEETCKKEKQKTREKPTRKQDRTGERE